MYLGCSSSHILTEETNCFSQGSPLSEHNNLENKISKKQHKVQTNFEHFIFIFT